MKRPFFFTAIFISLLVWFINIFIKYDLYQPGHISYFVSEKPRYLAVEGAIVSIPILKRSAFGEAYSFLVRPKLVRAGDLRLRLLFSPFKETLLYFLQLFTGNHGKFPGLGVGP